MYNQPPDPYNSGYNPQQQPPSGQPPYGQDPYSGGYNPQQQPPSGQPPYGQDPYSGGYNPQQQPPSGQPPYGQDPYSGGYNPQQQQPYGQPLPPYAQGVPPYAQAYNVNVQFGAVGQQKDWLVTLLLCIFVGWLGVHRFYTGHIAIGIVQLLTLGGCGIWTLVDFIMILTNSFTDSNGLPLKRT